MKIKFGAIITDGRGKIGGQVVSKNAGGSYMKNKVTPSNPQTARQTFVRALFGAISAAWSGLTAAQISAWNEAVSDWTTTNVFGDLKKPTGKALFQRLNNQAQSAGLSAITEVPAKLEMPNAPVTAVPIAVGAGTMGLTNVDESATTQIVVWGAAPVSNGTKNVKSKLRQLYAVSADAYSATDALDAYEAKFGAVNVDQNIFIGVRYVLASGQASPLQVQRATISA